MARLLANRLVHSVVLVLMAALIIYGLPDSVPRHEIIFAAFVVVAWMLGQRFERAIILDAELADPEDVREVEREASSFFDWFGGL
jgi:hypothetical protein